MDFIKVIVLGTLTLAVPVSHNQSYRANLKACLGIVLNLVDGMARGECILPSCWRLFPPFRLRLCQIRLCMQYMTVLEPPLLAKGQRASRPGPNGSILMHRVSWSGNRSTSASNAPVVSDQSRVINHFFHVFMITNSVKKEMKITAVAANARLTS